MWWECSECGTPIECAMSPVTCPECETNAVVFARVFADDRRVRWPTPVALEEWRQTWVSAGISAGIAAPHTVTAS